MAGSPPKLITGEEYTISFNVSALTTFDDAYMITLSESLSDYSGVADLSTSAEPDQPLTYVPVMKICYYGATTAPSYSPTFSPSTSPTTSPTMSPTPSPTVDPSTAPSQSPTTSPTPSPSQSPTTSPTMSPTISPTNSPTEVPTTPHPTLSPSPMPTPAPVIPSAIEYNPTIFSTSETFDVYHYILFFAAGLICLGMCCSRTPCCWNAGANTKGTFKKEIDKGVKKYNEMAAGDEEAEEANDWMASRIDFPQHANTRENRNPSNETQKYHQKLSASKDRSSRNKESGYGANQYGSSQNDHRNQYHQGGGGTGPTFEDPLPVHRAKGQGSNQNAGFSNSSSFAPSGNNGYPRNG